MDKVRLFERKPFTDNRGLFVKLYDDRETGIFFVEDDISINHRDVLRGIHGDSATWKLVSCLSGSIFAVVVEPDRLKWDAWHISSENWLQLLIPPKFGLGYLALSEPALVHYKQSSRYGDHPQFTIRWDDPKLKIDWPREHPILSDRDARA